jgi:hypothetical protein
MDKCARRHVFTNVSAHRNGWHMSCGRWGFLPFAVCFFSTFRRTPVAESGSKMIESVYFFLRMGLDFPYKSSGEDRVEKYFFFLVNAVRQTSELSIFPRIDDFFNLQLCVVLWGPGGEMTVGKASFFRRSTDCLDPPTHLESHSRRNRINRALAFIFRPKRPCKPPASLCGVGVPPLFLTPF